MTNANGDVVSYAYDLYGNKTSMTYPDGRAVHCIYDSMNRMTSVTGLDGEVTTYAYDAAVGTFAYLFSTMANQIGEGGKRRLD